MEKLVADAFAEPFPHLIIKNFYNEDELKLIWEELNYYTKPGKLLEAKDYGGAGFLVENGEFKYPINEITIAGNLKDMFQNITLANDLEFKYATNSPTMLIEGMVIAGK